MTAATAAFLGSPESAADINVLLGSFVVGGISMGSMRAASFLNSMYNPLPEATSKIIFAGLSGAALVHSCAYAFTCSTLNQTPDLYEFIGLTAEFSLPMLVGAFANIIMTCLRDQITLSNHHAGMFRHGQAGAHLPQPHDNNLNRLRR